MILEGSLSVKAALQNGRRKVHRLLIDDREKDRDTGDILFLAREMNIPIKDLITHEFSLDKLNEAMEVNVSQQGIKICYVAK